MTRTITILIAAACLTAGTAHAQGRELEAGRAAREAGDHESALAHFSAAWTDSAAPVARAEMAIEELALESFVLAEAHATEALSFASDADIATLREQLELTRSSAGAHLGSLDVIAPVSAEIRVDGELIGSAPLSRLARVRAGLHTVVASLPDHEPANRVVAVEAEGVTRIELSPVLIDRRPILERTGGTGDSARVVGYSALALGGAVLIVGGVTLGVAIDRDQQLLGSSCAPTSPMETREARCPRLASERGTFTDVSRATLLVGVVLAAVGIVLVVTAPSAPESSTPTVACGPAFELGAACTGTF